MSEERSAIIKAGMDTTGVRKGVDEVKGAMRDAARSVEADSRKAADGVEGIGDGAKRGADGLNRETGRMIASIQRAQAAALAGGRQTADYFEAIGKQRGLSADVLAPYLEGLRAAEAAQKAATGSLGTMGISAKQTAAALRGVPAQFTDIITSLQGGQAPLTVFLQQGGQLKDMFGGVGQAAQALGGYVLGLINPFTVLAALSAVTAAGFMAGARETQEFVKALVLSGNAAGTTAGQLSSMAAAIAQAGPATQGKAAELLVQLAAAGEVGAASLQRFAEAAINLERAGGPAAEETAKAFASLAKEPLAASIKLTESTRYLTAAAAEQIAELEKQGKATEAARVAQNAYATAIEERTPQLVARLGLIERAWIGIKDATKGAINAVVGIGRAKELTEQLRAVSREIAAFDAGAGNLRVDSDRGAQIAAQRKALVDRLEFLQNEVRLEEGSADAAAARVRTDEAGIKWLKDGEKYLSSSKKLSEEILLIRTQGVAAGKTEAEIGERIAAANDRANKSANKTAESDRKRELEQQLRLVSELSGVSSTYVHDLQRLDAARRTGLVGEQQYSDLMLALINRQPMVRDQAQELARVAKLQAAAVRESEEAYTRYLAGLDKNLEAGDRTLNQLRLELVELVAGKAARLELELQERERLAITYEQSAASAELDRTDSTRYRKLAEQVREEIRLRRSVAEATTNGEVRKANQRAAEEAARDWERTADQVGQSLSDALFNGGKNAGELLRGYFRSLVLQPVIKAVLGPLAASLSGVFGSAAAQAAQVSGAAGGAGGGGGGLLSALGLAGGLGSVFTQGVQLAINGGGLAGLQGAGSMLANGSITQGLAQGAGVFAAYGGGAAIGIGAGRAISGGYAVGGSGNAPINAGVIIGSILGGPIGGAIGGAIGGLANRAFGRKLENSGFEGSFGAKGDFSGNQFESYKGGWFRSDSTKRSPLDAQLGQALGAGGQAVFAQVQAYAEVLGLPVEAMAGYTKQINVSLKGLSQEQAQEAVAKAVQDFQDGLIGQFAAQLAPLRRAGETLVQVAGRLTELTVFSQAINELGGVFSRVAGLSIDAREQLIGLAGGMQALSTQALSFAQQYYSRDEIAGVKAREIQGVLSAAGITQDVATREQFRALVEGADISTSTGREQLAQLLRIAGDFASVADYLTETGSTLAGAASLAPSTGALAELFTQPVQVQVNAINNVAVQVSIVNDSINRMAEYLLESQNYLREVGGPA